MKTSTTAPKGRLSWLWRWFDSSAAYAPAENLTESIDWARCIPFIAMHVLCLTVIAVGFSWTAFWVAAVLYAVRMFAITGFYHRYFSHRAFKTSRGFQFLMAVAGNACVQRGPLWWAAHHRHHHAHSDEEPDPHSPGWRGFWMSHLGWFMTRSAYPTQVRYVPDLAKYPELRFLDRFSGIVPLALIASLFAGGEILRRQAPSLDTTGPQLVVWGFLISTVVLYHASFTINSLAHGRGFKRYASEDDSRNNPVLALLTFGEGWHNNHHHYPAAARQGFYWWEIDLTYYALVLLSWLGLIWDLRQVPPEVLASDRVD